MSSAEAASLSTQCAIPRVPPDQHPEKPRGKAALERLSAREKPTLGIPCNAGVELAEYQREFVGISQNSARNSDLSRHKIADLTHWAWTGRSVNSPICATFLLHFHDTAQGGRAMSPAPRVEDYNHTAFASLADILRLLSVARRQYIILLVHAHRADEPIAVRDLAKRIAGFEQAIDPAQVRNETYRSVHNALTQMHLQKLHEAAIIEYDGDRKTVEADANLDPVAHFIVLALGLPRLLHD